jgi:hypothetical protein
MIKMLPREDIDTAISPDKTPMEAIASLREIVGGYAMTNMKTDQYILERICLCKSDSPATAGIEWINNGFGISHELNDWEVKV